MRIIFWSLVAVLLAAVPIAVKASEYWRSLDAEISLAEKDGVLGAPNDGPLSLAEKAVVVAELDGAWGKRGEPCRALDWRAFTRRFAGAEEHLPGRTVSQAVAGLPELSHAKQLDPIERHVRGVLLTCQLERRYTDKQLLRMWLPHADFGGEAEGIDAGARALFGKPASTLDLEEASRLAALARSPKYFSKQKSAWDERARRIAEQVGERGGELE